MSKAKLLLSLWTAAALLSMAACGSAPSDADLFRIVGSDERQLLPESEGERLMVGSLAWEGQPVCTAVVFATQNIITAAHCLQNRDEGAFTFETADGSFAVSRRESRVFPSYDIALLRVLPAAEDESFAEEAYPSEVHTFQTMHPLAYLRDDRDFELVSAIAGQRLLASRGQADELAVDALGLYHYELDTEIGSSGSPLLQDGFVIGIHIGFKDGMNVAVSSRTILGLLRFGSDEDACAGSSSLLSCFERKAFLRELEQETCYRYIADRTTGATREVACTEGRDDKGGDRSGPSSTAGSSPSSPSGSRGPSAGTGSGGPRSGSRSGPGAGPSAPGLSGPGVFVGPASPGSGPRGPGSSPGGPLNEGPMGFTSDPRQRAQYQRAMASSSAITSQLLLVQDTVQAQESAPPTPMPPPGPDFPRGERYLQEKEKQVEELKSSPDYEARKTLLSAAQSAMGEARAQYRAGNSEQAQLFYEFGLAVADVAVSATPIVGWGKDLYEAITGRGLLTSEKLSDFDRTMAVVGVLTAGIGSKLAVAGKMGVIFGVMGKAASGADEAADLAKAIDRSKDIFDAATKLGIAEAVEAKLLAKALNADKVNPFELSPTHALTMSSNAFNALKNSMQKDGMLRETIKTVTHNGQKYIVDGHHRARAAKELGWKEVPIEEVTLPFQGYKTTDDLFN